MERYEQTARQEWEKLKKGSEIPIPSDVIAWEYWKKAFQVVMEKYKWTDNDMLSAHEGGRVAEGEYITGISDDILDGHGWLKEYEQQLQTEQNTNS